MKPTITKALDSQPQGKGCEVVDSTVKELHDILPEEFLGRLVCSPYHFEIIKFGKVSEMEEYRKLKGEQAYKEWFKTPRDITVLHVVASEDFTEEVKDCIMVLFANDDLVNNCNVKVVVALVPKQEIEDFITQKVDEAWDHSQERCSICGKKMEGSLPCNPYPFTAIGVCCEDCNKMATQERFRLIFLPGQLKSRIRKI